MCHTVQKYVAAIDTIKATQPDLWQAYSKMHNFGFMSWEGQDLIDQKYPQMTNEVSPFKPRKAPL
jgi:hypothetical protein